MSFYLQEQGESYSPRQLASLINELAISDAEIANSKMSKGKWEGADYIINGKILENSQGHYIKYYHQFCNYWRDSLSVPKFT